MFVAAATTNAAVATRPTVCAVILQFSAKTHTELFVHADLRSAPPRKAKSPKNGLLTVVDGCPAKDIALALFCRQRKRLFFGKVTRLFRKELACSFAARDKMTQTFIL